MEAGIDIHSPSRERTPDLQASINRQMAAAHEEAVMDFPEWLAKRRSRAGENNTCFSLAEIRDEYLCKKRRFGFWRAAAKFGFFTDTRPQSAGFNKIVHLEIRETETGRVL